MLDMTKEEILNRLKGEGRDNSSIQSEKLFVENKVLKRHIEDILKAYKDQQLYKHITDIYSELDKNK